MRAGQERLLRFWVCLLILVTLGAPGAAAQVPPDAAWRTLDTEHFRVNYVAGLDSLARSVAGRAEAAYAVLAGELPHAPRGKIEVMLADNVDFTNGSATPFPTNRIVLYAHPPADNPELAFTTDWLQLIVLHELVHIFHLDTSEGIWDRLRGVFGRNPLLFPEIFAPTWVMEGIATFYESRLTSGGRLRGSAFEMALRTAILEDRFFSIDRVSGDPALWPGGNSRYIYGASFFDFLARQHGDERVSQFIRRYGRQWVPYRLDATARRTFGRTFSSAWRAWRDSLETRYSALADSLRATGLTEPEILTADGYHAYFPRFSPDGASIAYAAATGRDEAATRLVAADGSVRTVAERTSLGPASWQPDGGALVLAQLNFVDPYRIYADLYRVEVGGEQDRLTRGERIWAPSVHPDGRRVVAVGNGAGTNRLVIRDLATGASRPITRAAPDTFYALPRWSPAGDRIAVSRFTRGGLFDVVVMDSAGTGVRELTRDRAIDAAPAWSPDGRYVVFSSDRTGIPNLFAYDLEAARLLQVTNVLTGAVQPDVSPDGRWIAFSYYRADGYHVARIPFEPGRWRPAPPPREGLAPLAAAEPDPRAALPSRPYSPWPSIAPAMWMLLAESGTALGLGAGVALRGVDAIQRHAWETDVTVYPEDGRVEGGAAYRFRGWGNPLLDASLFQRWSVTCDQGVTGCVGQAPLATALLRRQREANASVLLLRRRWRSSAWLRPGAEVGETEFVWDEPEAIGNRALRQLPVDLGATLEAGFSSARGYAFSLGSQDGITNVARLEAHRYASPIADEPGRRGYTRLTNRARGFQSLPLPGFARHVVAARVDAGGETGSISPGFSIGGASGGAAPLPLAAEFLEGSSGFPIRGYPEGVQTGNRALSASAEYRFPLLLVERGFRLVPVFLDRVWGDLFVDAATAWCAGACARHLSGAPAEPRPLFSVGAELNLDLRLAFMAGLPLRFGVALPLRDRDAHGPSYYVRLGPSF